MLRVMSRFSKLNLKRLRTILSPMIKSLRLSQALTQLRWRVSMTLKTEASEGCSLDPIKSDGILTHLQSGTGRFRYASKTLSIDSA